jgi:hypothetical protein
LGYDPAYGIFPDSNQYWHGKGKVVTLLYITVDTEYSAGLFRQSGKDGRRENFARSISGKTSAGDAGIFYQMDVLDRAGHKAVFFVDPMPALVWGVEAIADIVGPIVARGHDVQLHLHSEWLEFAFAANPLGDRTGANIKDFTMDEQCTLLDYARATLIAAGAPAPLAFRAGNYGANDDTLRALGMMGMRYDTSLCPGIAASDCEISLPADTLQPVEHCGVVEVPIGCIQGQGASLRHFQLTALTVAEIMAALAHAARQGQTSMTLVSHSFELLSRDRQTVNRIVRRRFDRLCAAIAARPEITTATYQCHRPQLGGDTVGSPLPHSNLRTARRIAEQALANSLYGAR